MMTTADDHWPATLERVVAALDFELTNASPIAPAMRLKPRQDIKSFPALVQTAVHATIEVDRWVAERRPDPLIDRDTLGARRSLVEALVKEPAGSTHSPFTDGYAVIYRAQLRQLMWKAIADHPRRRLEELAAGRG